MFVSTNIQESHPSLTRLLSFLSSEHGPPLGDGVAPADSLCGRSVLHLQRDHAVHVQDLSAQQSRGDH